MSVKERLEEYIKYKGIKNSDFCREINVSGAFISSMRVSIQPDKLKSIALKFTDLNTEWLLTGEGDMLKSAVNQNNVKGDNIQGHNVTVNKTQTEKFLEMIKTRDEQINKSQEQISKGQEQIDRLIGIIEKLNSI